MAWQMRMASLVAADARNGGGVRLGAVRLTWRRGVGGGSLAVERPARIVVSVALCT